MMPEMDGFEFLEKLRQKPEWCNIPIVVVTARDLTDEQRSRLNVGVEHIIQKTKRDEMFARKWLARLPNALRGGKAGRLERRE